MITKEFFVKLFFTTVYLMTLYYAGKQFLFHLSDVTSDNVSVACEYVPDTNVGMCNYAEVEIEEPKEVKEPKEINLGKFKLTAYCPCKECCGKTDGITATGTKAKAGRTIAVDTDIIPYGSKVMINNKEYVAEDCGGAINNNHIDVFFNTHDEALEFGVQYACVYIKK